VFSKGTRNWNDLAECGGDVIGIDHGISLKEATAALPSRLAVQGNLDPSLLVGEPELVVRETRRLMSDMRGRNGWIFNLGHGLPPAANLESISALTQTIRNFA
jgi:uroporphyrinogen decarboxylase